MQIDIKETKDTEALRYEKPTASVSLYEIYKELVLNPEASFLIE